MHTVLDTAARQTANTAQNLVRGSAAGVRQRISITRWANRLIIGGTSIARASVRKERDEGVYVLSRSDVERGYALTDSMFVTPDGYLRRTPVQETMVAPGYRRRQILRVLGVLLLAAVVFVGAYVLIQAGFLTF